MAAIRGAPTGKQRAFYDAIEAAARDVLNAAGWKPEERAGVTIWRSPIDRHWYDELRALAILKGGADPGGSD
jgi:hypothetical protein